MSPIDLNFKWGSVSALLLKTKGCHTLFIIARVSIQTCSKLTTRSCAFRVIHQYTIAVTGNPIVYTAFRKSVLHPNSAPFILCYFYTHIQVKAVHAPSSVGSWPPKRWWWLSNLWQSIPQNLFQSKVKRPTLQYSDRACFEEIMLESNFCQPCQTHWHTSWARAREYTRTHMPRYWNGWL
jgi:hypothetical protein